MDAPIILECNASLTSSPAVRECESQLIAAAAPSVSGRDVQVSGSVVGLTLLLCNRGRT